MTSRLAVVLPAFNESAGLESLLWRVQRALSGRDYLIVVVDDGSTDGTAEIAESLAGRLPIRLIRHDSNRGYGAAMRTGMLVARELADVVVTMDADDSHDPSLIPLMLDTLACGSDLIIASRFVPGGRMIGVPLHRTVLSFGAAVVFSRLIHIPDVKDYTCGYRAYKRGLLNRLIAEWGPDAFVQETGFCVGVELLTKADLLGASIAEVPLVLRYDRKRSASKLQLRRTLEEYVNLVRRIRSERGVAPTPASGQGHSRRAAPQGEGLALSLITDIGAVLLSFLVSFFVYRSLVDAGIVNRGSPEPLRYALLAGLYAATTVFAFWRFGLYRSRLSVLNLRHLEIVAQALTVSIAVFFAILFFSSGQHPSRLLVFGAMALSFPIVLMTRRLVSTRLRTRWLRTGSTSRILIYGVGDTGRLLMKKLLQAPRLGAEVVGFVDDSAPVGQIVRCRVSQMNRDYSEARVLGTIEELPSVARETEATELCVAIPDIPATRLEALRNRVSALGLDLGIVPRFGDVRPDQLRVEDLGALPILRFEPPRVTRTLEIGKRTVDILGVLLMAPVTLPLGLLTAAAVRMDGKPVLFRQTRIGRDGRPFTLFKFRTMYPRVDPYASSPTDEFDPRLTRVGRIIRVAGLDELPQLLNVLRGDMSLVGPRPEMPQIVAAYGPIERARLAARPGLTGIWQLSPDRSQAIHDNLEYDLYYLSQRSLTLDFLVLGETVIFVIRALGRSVARGMRRLRPAAIRRLLDPRLLWSGGASTERNGDAAVVFVALDQRRRPDEPSSWRVYVPRVQALLCRCVVKLLVAQPNLSRLAELAPEDGNAGSSGRLEYVPYEPDAVRFLASEADCVVTDLQHVAEWASGAGVPTFLINDGEFRLQPGQDGRKGNLTDAVRSAFTSAISNLPAMA